MKKNLPRIFHKDMVFFYKIFQSLMLKLNFFKPCQHSISKGTEVSFTHIYSQGAFTYDVRSLGRQVSRAVSDFTKQAYVVKNLIRVGRQVKNTPKPSDVICECSQIKKTYTVNVNMQDPISAKGISYVTLTTFYR